MIVKPNNHGVDCGHRGNQSTGTYADRFNTSSTFVLGIAGPLWTLKDTPITQTVEGIPASGMCHVRSRSGVLVSRRLQNPLWGV